MSRRATAALAFLLPVTIAAASTPAWLPLLGSALVRAEEPAAADVAVVLAGDSSGLRILRGAELAREGFVRKVVVSGPTGRYGTSEDKLAIAFAVAKGYPESMFEGMPVNASSTREEAAEIVPRLRRKGVRTILLITSDYHTGRAGRLWRAAAPGIGVRVVAAPDQYFRAEKWWYHRESRKCVFYEWVKTITSPFGI
ncbi:MAG: YdcF family protein [Bryobacteraceae bacterium]